MLNISSLRLVHHVYSFAPRPTSEFEMAGTASDSGRRTPSNDSIISNSSRASDAYYTDAERGEKAATRLSRRTVSENGGKSLHESERSFPASFNRNPSVRSKREFKGRHIQMMGIGTT